MDHVSFPDPESLLNSDDLYACHAELQDGEKDLERAKARIAEAQVRLTAFKVLLGADRVQEILERFAKVLAEQNNPEQPNDDDSPSLDTPDEVDDRPNPKMKEEMEATIKDFLRQTGPSKAGPILKKLAEMEPGGTPRWSPNYPYQVLSGMVRDEVLLRDDGVYRLRIRPRPQVFDEDDGVGGEAVTSVSRAAGEGGARTDA